MNIDDNENGLENQFVDPFAPTVSNEAFPFPVEQFIPSMKVEVPAEPLPEHGSLAENALAPTDVSEFTDTPEDPSQPPPEGAVEEKISLEVDEDFDLLNTPEVNAALESVEVLGDFYKELLAIGGISQNDVYRIEGLHPGLITEQRKLAAFSHTPSVVGYNVALESVSSKLWEGIQSIIARIAAGIERLFSLGFELLFNTSEKVDFTKLKAEWERILSKAGKVDSTKGMGHFRKVFPNLPEAAKASTTKHFVTMVADRLLKDQYANRFTVGWRSIQSGGDLTNQTDRLVGALSSIAENATKAVNDLEKGQVTKASFNWNGIAGIAIKDGQLDREGLDAFLARARSDYQAPAKPYSTSMQSCVDVKSNLSGQVAKLKKAKDSFKSLQAKLNQIANSKPKDQQDLTAVKEAAKSTANEVQIANDVFRLYKMYLDIYVSYYNSLTNVVSKVSRMVDQIYLSK